MSITKQKYTAKDTMYTVLAKLKGCHEMIKVHDPTLSICDLSSFSTRLTPGTSRTLGPCGGDSKCESADVEVLYV